MFQHLITAQFGQVDAEKYQIVLSAVEHLDGFLPITADLDSHPFAFKVAAERSTVCFVVVNNQQAIDLSRHRYPLLLTLLRYITGFPIQIDKPW